MHDSIAGYSRQRHVHAELRVEMCDAFVPLYPVGSLTIMDGVSTGVCVCVCMLLDRLEIGKLAAKLIETGRCSAGHLLV